MLENFHTNLQLYDEDAVERSDPGGSPASPDQLTEETKRDSSSIFHNGYRDIQMHSRSHHPNNDDSFTSRKSDRLYITDLITGINAHEKIHRTRIRHDTRHAVPGNVRLPPLYAANVRHELSE